MGGAEPCGPRPDITSAVGNTAAQPYALRRTVQHLGLTVRVRVDRTGNIRVVDANRKVARGGEQVVIRSGDLDGHVAVCLGNARGYGEIPGQRIQYDPLGQGAAVVEGSRVAESVTWISSVEEGRYIVQSRLKNIDRNIVDLGGGGNGLRTDIDQIDDVILPVTVTVTRQTASPAYIILYKKVLVRNDVAVPVDCLVYADTELCGQVIAVVIPST